MSTKKKASILLKKEIGSLNFGTFLRAARSSQGLTQAEMAKILGVSVSVICDIEKGRQLVSPSLAVKIAKKAKLSKKLAVKLCLQDQLDKAKIKMEVDIAS